MEKVHPTLHISQRIGNIYTGSLFAGLVSLLTTNPDIKNKNVMLFSYGSGLCSTMLTLRIHQNPLNKEHVSSVLERLNNRIKISPEEYTAVMLEREKNFGKYKGPIKLNEQYLDDNVFYLTEIDEKWRRSYDIKNPSTIGINKRNISSMLRLENLNKNIENEPGFNKFYKLSVNDRIEIVNEKIGKEMDRVALQSGGLNIELADSMIENVIGTLSLPLAVIPQITINNKKYMVPMCVEEPSVVAACSSIGKLLGPYSFFSYSQPNIMIGQVHLPGSEPEEIYKILTNKVKIIEELNLLCKSMVLRGGGVIDLRARNLKGKEYSLDILINVCEAMGANITNTICERTKEIVSKLGVKTGIAILSNYCTERKAFSYFELPIKDLGWKGVDGAEVAEKILEAYSFAVSDRYRTATHNKGVMNGVDSVCVATGQDWRAVESAAHCHASRNNSYLPFTSYEILERDGEKFLKGSIELPIAVGTKGGVVERNPLYKYTLDILGNPSASELSQILVTVGLAQNFAALRALAIEGINKGHMVLHARTIAQKAGIPKHLVDDACKYMAYKKKYDLETVAQFMKQHEKPKL